jgi:hypothetical protein
MLPSAWTGGSSKRSHASPQDGYLHLELAGHDLPGEDRRACPQLLVRVLHLARCGPQSERRHDTTLRYGEVPTVIEGARIAAIPGPLDHDILRETWCHGPRDCSLVSVKVKSEANRLETDALTVRSLREAYACSVSIASKLRLKPGQRVALVGERRGADLEVDPDVLHDDPSSADLVIVFVTCTPDLEALGGVAEGAAMRGAGAWIAHPKAPPIRFGRPSGSGRLDQMVRRTESLEHP